MIRIRQPTATRENRGPEINHGKDAKLNKRLAPYLFLLMTLMVSAGANCQRVIWRSQPLPPAVFPQQPTLQQVLNVVNGNRARVSSVSTSQATISTPGVPSMRAELHIAGPRHLRMTARTGLTGKELDLGSNNEMFWIWIKRNQPPGIYFARHDSFAASPLQQSIPVRPEWLIEAVGMVYLEPTAAHQGPFVRNDGRLEIHTPVHSPQGPMTKVVVIDGRSGWVLEQHLLGPKRELIASAVNSRHVQDPATGFTMPHKTDVSWPATGMRLSLELTSPAFNSPTLDPELWIKPSYPGYPDRDLTQMAPPVAQTPAPNQLPAGPAPYHR